MHFVSTKSCSNVFQPLNAPSDIFRILYTDSLQMNSFWPVWMHVSSAGVHQNLTVVCTPKRFPFADGVTTWVAPSKLGHCAFNGTRKGQASVTAQLTNWCRTPQDGQCGKDHILRPRAKCKLHSNGDHRSQATLAMVSTWMGDPSILRHT